MAIPGMFYIDPNGGCAASYDVIFDNFVAGQIDDPVLASIVSAQLLRPPQSIRLYSSLLPEPTRMGPFRTLRIP